MYTSAGRRSTLGAVSLIRSADRRCKLHTTTTLTAQDTAKDDQRSKDSRIDTRPSSEKQKTVAQRDQELMEKMAGLSGDGGESGVEYEDGKPVAMKRGVRENMFRYI